jgi:hypothetical protein
MAVRLTSAQGADASDDLTSDRTPVAIGPSAECEVVSDSGEITKSISERSRPPGGMRGHSRGTVRAALALLAAGWRGTSKRARVLIASGIALALLGTIAAQTRHTFSDSSGPLPKEPTVLSRSVIEESFGLGEGVTYLHPDAKAFDFDFHAPGRAMVLLHFQSRDISDGELMVTANGEHVGAVPPDLLAGEDVFHEMIIRPELLRKGKRNRIAFESTRNPPHKDPWRVFNLWIEANALPQVPPDQLLQEATAVFRRAEQNFMRRDVAASNRYTAWKDYRSAWLMMQALPDPKHELYLRAQDRMREAQAELDRLCATLMLQVQRSHSFKDWASAREALDEVRSYFPGGDQACPWKAEQKRAELKL